MTVLTVVQDVSMTVGISRPLQVFGSTKREMLEMQSVVNENYPRGLVRRYP